MDLDERSDRRVLPIWNESADAASLPELRPVNDSKSVVEYRGSASELLEEFNFRPSEGVAIDLLSSSFLERSTEGLQVAIGYLRDNPKLPPEVIRILKICTGEEVGAMGEGHPIARLRKKIKQESRDPLAWVDLAREYTKIGAREQATRAMLTALQLAKGHRWITRVAARFFVHFDQPDMAQSIILRNPSASGDPWLAATEIAVSQIAQVNPKLWNSGKKLLNRGFRSLYTTELSSSIATMEFFDGAIKKARLLFQESLVEPNKTTLAQAKWAERNSSLKLIGGKLKGQFDAYGAYEAQFWEAYNNKDISGALEFARRWLKEEPYSSKAAISVSVTAALLDDYEELESSTQLGLMANPNDLTLKLNRIYAWLAKSEPDSTSLYLDLMKFGYERQLLQFSTRDDQYAAHACANLGMLYYRTNRIELGQSYYLKAEEKFLSENSSTSAMMALLNHSREAIISGSPYVLSLLDRVKREMQSPGAHNTPGTEYYAAKLSRLAKSPSEWRVILSERIDPDVVDNELLLVDKSAAPRFEFEGEKSVIWLPKGFKAKK